MSIMSNAADAARASHPCTNCRYRDGDWCKWSDITSIVLPHHVTWWSIDWDARPECRRAPTLDELEG